MRKNSYSIIGFLALICAIVFVSLPLEKASANEIIPGFEALTEDYNLKEVKIVHTDDFEDSLNFDTIEEFESFLRNEKKNNLNVNVLQGNKPQQFGSVALMATSSTTDTYTFSEYTGVSTITLYAKVTRNTSGIVTKVLVWSSQTGIAFPISYVQNETDYTLNSTKKGGKAYVYGTKSYGVTIGGQGIAYKLDVTYTVPF